MEKKQEFQPYIPASKITPELTVTSVIMGVLLAVVFGAGAKNSCVQARNAPSREKNGGIAARRGHTGGRAQSRVI